MKNWERSMDYSQTGLSWVQPSPNMPTLDTAWVYPGMCLIEGTNISEGRGTTKPFEIIGTPYIDPDELAHVLNNLGLQGTTFRPLTFIPTFQKWCGQNCGGVQIHVTDRKQFKPFLTGIAVIREIAHMYPESFKWRNPPYEFETIKMPIDILTGDSSISHMINNYAPLEIIESSWQKDLDSFQKLRKQFLIYK
ncbi:MAG: hypothetical protein A2161_15490 [Candidatus Schekmanbacteria bacterium RBG_13_48_7]|uniref:DUF1343 domain-containing protein n=1 Tax=Candidatus Schekmanbacteria bacterium RBG_13_48_7 TaxID=1817878 RepID=A0A1F7S1P1_9BACT|nr:MAG: hypothetical protein A2161_15490 [Candidatus Schekmanbacteria bacterium RBG_13_48_7]